ncbi:hypothetical protein C7974DRAFT_401906 [Boeremia exigua]|uniref:uncharacterized protein n=1 Tax=Boeremia exigua TaxID=749465 RepID=UPI001E8D1B74|nr:uncharacterized protein C7974DRAFT_401906 [Boeremia exigua]KAH6616516.1 hypothetical protein C7974DRAFT_401906 [Boeremia exigua]
MSRPTISKGKTSYPIFAASFATSRPGVLVVGGGGGGGRHGVKNKITLFDFASRAPTVEPIAEIEASTDDSVTCLANLATKDGLILYAGVNSSEEDRAKDNNEHFRAFEAILPKGKIATEGTDVNISYLSKTRLFAPVKDVNAKKEGYQRLIRLSPPQRTAASPPARRIGAIASSLAGDENEIVVFSAISNKPKDPQDILQRIRLGKNEEANDIDIFDKGNGQFELAYVLDYDVIVHNISTTQTKPKDARRKLYSIPLPAPGQKGGRSKLRCIRWLTPEHLLLLVNKPNRTGVEVLLVHMYEEGPGSVVVRKTLPKRVKAATDMDVALLDPDSSGAYQIAIAIAAIDISLHVYSIDYNGRLRNSLSPFHHFATYDDVHEVQMTKAVFSPFHKPVPIPDQPSDRKAVPQYLRLASTSLGNTVSVETFELQPYNGRHVLQTARTRNLYSAATYIVIAMVVAAIALMIQSILDPQGELTKNIIPSSLQNIGSQYKPMGEMTRDKRHQAALNNADTPTMKTVHRIQDLLHLHMPHHASPDPPAQQKALVIHHDPEGAELSTEVHESTDDVVKKHAEARQWAELSEEERHYWRKKLSDAGMWAVGEGETILKSIFFGNIAGAIGAAAQGVIG